LSGDLGTSERELYYSLRFYRVYPILPHASKLSWSEYRDLLSVDDPKERQVLVERTEKENWTRDRLRKEVKVATGKSSASELVSEKLSPSTPGKPGTYKIVKATVGPETGKWVIDLGFSNYYKTSKDLRFKEGAIIEEAFAVPGAGSAPSDLIKLSKRTPEDLYTYCAYVVKVLDGDTLKVVVDLGFGVRSVQTLRLLGIDAPEIVTADGMESKKALEKMLKIADGKAGAPLLIKTVKSDKYDRYLADIFVGSVYINQKLIDEGLAVLMEE
jgi:micrococcal nuclease